MKTIKIEARLPFIISDSTAYIVTAGNVDVFFVDFVKGSPGGRRHFMFTASEGDIIYGPTKSFKGKALLLSGLYGTEIREAAADEAKEKSLKFAELAANSFAPISETAHNITDKTSIKKGQYFFAQRPTAVIISGEASFNRIPAPKKFILSKAPFLAHSDLEVVPTKDSAIESIDLYMTAFLMKSAYEHQVSLAQFKAKIAENKAFISDGLNRLVNIIKGDAKKAYQGEPHFVIAQMIADDLGMNIIKPKHISKNYVLDPLGEIARVSKFMTRPVTLEGDWWKHDSGPIFGFIQDAPIAIIPIKGVYHYILPTGERVKINEKNSETINSSAYMMYKPFENKALGLWDIFKFSMRPNTMRDFLTIAIFGAAMSGLGSLTPVITANIFDSVIPSAEYGTLLYITIFLICITCVRATFSIARSIASKRFEGRVDYMMQSAIWSRLLALPVPFFDKYNASDLSARANTISAIRRMLTGAAMSSILDAAFSFIPFAILFTFSLKLALIAIVLTAIPVAMVFIFGKLRLSLVKKSIEVNSKASSTIMQILDGISKFKMIGGEDRAFSLWSEQYYNEHKIQDQAGTLGDANSLFNGIYPVITSIIVFYFVAKSSDISIGQYMGFQAAFSMFMNSLLGLSSTAVSMLRIMPLYDRARPILEAIPEVTEQKQDPGKLAGGIKVANLSYKYETSDMVLKNISFEAKPGEFIAFVGSSGSGKSTIVRLLLGFDKPQDGTISYDDYNLSDIDIQAVRREMGVVLQKGQLMPGDIFTNVIGPYNLSMDDAWAAIRAAGFEEDVKAMPMGLNTVVGSGTLSGGQRQRVLIARALVNKPKMIIFDAATSALDNKTQSVVLESLNKLNATKIVISHRLSTIIHADRIYVLDGGEIVESGNYKELMEQNGVFAEFARRQIA